MELLHSATDGNLIYLWQALLICAAAGFAIWLVNARCRMLINGWASGGGWEVVSIRRRLMGTPQFSFMPGLPVFEVELQSRSGRQRQAVMRCGNLMLGVFAADVAVEWADAFGR